MDSPGHRKEAILRYLAVELEDEEIVHLERVANERVFGTEHDVWDVHTNIGRWWVVSNPVNLYTQDDFKSMDVVLSFHLGLMLRLQSRAAPAADEAELERVKAPWRRWTQAAEALDEADEAEDFQAIGMRCRECLIALAREMQTGPVATAASSSSTLKAADFVGWSGVVADTVASGSSAAARRSYLKAVARGAWDYVAWLTHAQNATRYDAVTAVEIVEHVLSTFGTALVRWEHGVPDRCPSCRSYLVVTTLRDVGAESYARVTLCETCGWENSPDVPAPAPRSRQKEPAAPAGDCVPSSDVQTLMTLDDYLERGS